MPESGQKVSRNLSASCHKVAKKLLKSCQKVARKLPEISQKVARKSWQSHEKVRRQSWDSHETVFCSIPVSDFADMFVLVCLLDYDWSLYRVATWPCLAFQAKAIVKSFVTDWVTDHFPSTALHRRHAQTVRDRSSSHKIDFLKGIKIPSVVQKWRAFYWRGGFCLLVELRREGSAPAACAAGLFIKKDKNLILWPLSTIKTFMTDTHTYGYGDSMTDPAQRSESVKMCWQLHRGCQI